jgi:hypothetical protein
MEQDGRRLNFMKCTQCRKDKQKVVVHLRASHDVSHALTLNVSVNQLTGYGRARNAIVALRRDSTVPGIFWLESNGLQTFRPIQMLRSEPTVVSSEIGLTNTPSCR